MTPRQVSESPLGERYVEPVQVVLLGVTWLLFAAGKATILNNYHRPNVLQTAAAILQKCMQALFFLSLLCGVSPLYFNDEFSLPTFTNSFGYCVLKSPYMNVFFHLLNYW